MEPQSGQRTGDTLHVPILIDKKEKNKSPGCRNICIPGIFRMNQAAGGRPLFARKPFYGRILIPGTDRYHC